MDRTLVDSSVDRRRVVHVARHSDDNDDTLADSIVDSMQSCEDTLVRRSPPKVLVNNLSNLTVYFSMGTATILTIPRSTPALIRWPIRTTSSSRNTSTQAGDIGELLNFHVTMMTHPQFHKVIHLK